VTELGDVGQDGHLHRIFEAPVHGQLGHRFRKDHVGAGFHAGERAFNSAVETFYGEGICARHDHECVVRSRIDGRLDAIDHLFLAHDFLAGTVTATFGCYLVLDMEARGTRFDE